MKTLHLVLKKKWFDMILSGEKKEEYRDIKPYWQKRFASILSDYEDSGYETITFTNGYSRNSPRMVIEFNGISISQGIPEWGADEGIDYYVLELGQVLSTKNIQK